MALRLQCKNCAAYSTMQFMKWFMLDECRKENVVRRVDMLHNSTVAPKPKKKAKVSATAKKKV